MWLKRGNNLFWKHIHINFPQYLYSLTFWLVIHASFLLVASKCQFPFVSCYIYSYTLEILSCTWTLLSSNIDWYELDHCYNYYYDYTLYDLDRIDAIFLDRLLEYRLWLNFIASNFKKKICRI